MVRNTICSIFLLMVINAVSQNPTIAYRSTENPHYWKNKSPILGYWQQDTYYKIQASLDDQTDIITGEEELTYFNNSPDTLTYVYFHLYENAFQPESYTEDLYRGNGIKVKYGKYESQKKGTEVISISINSETLKTELDNTILKVWLKRPLLPNVSVKIKISFKTYFDKGETIRRRMKFYKNFGSKHYDGVHWYPRIAVYDQKLGWDTDQHLTREFYGDYGVYDVEITLPSHYILDATGIMTNEQEMLPADLRQKLDIANFKNKPWGSEPSIILKADGTVKTWKFHSENTHDFAFTTSPNYRIGETNWNGIRVIALCEEQHCSGWQNASAFAAKVIEFYSKNIGMYAYPKMIVADAQDGMEYPMLTLDGGRDPDYRSLLAHEIGHNWFFGMVGSNETYRALLDEGFTQFIDSWCLRSIDGENLVHYQYKSNYVTKFNQEDKVINSEVYNSYIRSAANGDETIIDQHSDHFNGAIRHGGGYSNVYSKTATMLYNLQYVLGDSLFNAAFSHYFNQWKFCHPYVEDFRNSIIQFTNVDLNWFFDQWLTQGQTIDYSVKAVKKADSVNTYLVKFERHGRMQMPIDFTIISKDGKKYNYYIPNTWYEKKTNATILPRWIGWDKIRPSYTAKVVIEHGIANVLIDTTHRLADVNMLNNALKMPKEMIFDSKIYNTPSWENYTLKLRPDLWYNGYDGIKAGLFLSGDYLGTIKAFNLTVNLNTGIGKSQLESKDYLNKYDPFSVVFNFRTPTDKFIKNSAIYLNARHLDGLDAATAGFELWDAKRKNSFTIQYKMMYRKDSTDLTYLVNPNDWGVGKFNNTMLLSYEHPYNYYRGNGNIKMNLSTSVIGSDYDYHFLSINVVNKNDLGKININTRTFAQIGTGTNWASESMLYGAGANPESLMDNKYTRSVAIFPDNWGGYGADINHFQAGGGLNMRGYAGYLMSQLDKTGGVRNTYKGTTGYAENIELEFQELFSFIGRIAPKLNSVIGLKTYLFGDIGAINFNLPNESFAMSDFRADAGIGCALTIKRFPPLQLVKPLIIRFDMPLFLNSTPYNSPEYIQMRWVVGINRAF